MSPHEKPNIVPDRESQTVRARTGRPPAPRDSMLTAADAVFQHASADGLGAVTMDAVADAAHVGKGTLFRAFGDRNGLLDALSAAKFRPVREAVESESESTGPGTSAAGRAVSFLDAILAFKLDNANLMRAREAATGGDLASERYQWMHTVLRQLVTEATPDTTAKDAAYIAHSLLATLQMSLLDTLLADGYSVPDIRRCQRERVLALLGVDR